MQGPTPPTEDDEASIPTEHDERNGRNGSILHNRYFHPPHSPDGNHNTGSRAQNASIGNEPVVSKNTKRAPTTEQENQDHPGELLHDRLVLECDTRRSAASDDRKPAPKTKTDPPHQDDSPRLPKESKRRASTYPESEPVTKRAKKQHPPRQNCESELIALDCSNDILRSEHDVAKEDVLEKLLEDTDGITRRGSFLELIGDDLEVLVMLNLAYEDLEKTRKLRQVGGFRNLLHFPLSDTEGFPVSRGDAAFSSFKKSGKDVPQLEKLISSKIRHALLDMGCKLN
jgi:hypothetical protein